MDKPLNDPRDVPPLHPMIRHALVLLSCGIVALFVVAQIYVAPVPTPKAADSTQRR